MLSPAIVTIIILIILLVVFSRIGILIYVNLFLIEIFNLVCQCLKIIFHKI